MRSERFKALGPGFGGIAVAFVMLTAVSVAYADDPMTIDAMRSDIIGNSLAGTTENGDEYVEHYQPDGKIVGASKQGGAYEGQWSFRQDGLMCFKYGEGPFDGGCVYLTRQGDKVGFVRVDGSHEPTATLVQGKAPEIK